MEETFPPHFPLVQSSHASLARPFLRAVLFPSHFLVRSKKVPRYKKKHGWETAKWSMAYLQHGRFSKELERSPPWRPLKKLGKSLALRFVADSKRRYLKTVLLCLKRFKGTYTKEILTKDHQTGHIYKYINEQINKYINIIYKFVC